MIRDRESVRVLDLRFCYILGVCLVSGLDMGDKAGVSTGSEKTVLVIVYNSSTPSL